MKIGIMIHSQTGHTLSVGEDLKRALTDAGHEAVLEKVAAKNEAPQSAANLKMISPPDVSGYDALIFGAPVHGFSLSPVMKEYLSKYAQPGGEKVGCFVTQQLKKPWMGGNHAIRQMVALCEGKGAQVTRTGIVNWSGPTRQAQIEDIIGKMTSL